ncbi:cytokinin riboside 5'-monophosphate phosphoribohydrolase [Planctomycetota bacterium]|nr:cytokinin riboside 5'-monophosphate phosphoribohydrolase [Planctomycetota bacterium]
MSSEAFRVTVYASSSERIDRSYFPVAEELGRRIAVRGYELVWGGGRYGLMGAVSRGARAAGGKLRGVILQRFIDKNVHCKETKEMASVADMRTRKRGLDEAGDAFVALPGGLGTLEELLEILSFRQLGLHHRPVVVLNTRGYWDPLLEMLAKSFAEGFIQPHFRGIYSVASTPAEVIDQIDAGRMLPPVQSEAFDPLGGGSS